MNALLSAGGCAMRTVPMPIRMKKTVHRWVPIFATWTHIAHACLPLSPCFGLAMRRPPLVLSIDNVWCLHPACPGYLAAHARGGRHA